MTVTPDISVTWVSKHRIEAIMDTKNPARSIPTIMDDLAKIDIKQDKAINLEGAQKIEELGIELIRIARDRFSACF